MKHLGTGNIETKRLLLRRFTAEDAPAMYQNWASDPEVTKYLTWPTHANADVSRSVLETWIPQYEKPDFYLWAIVDRQSGPGPMGSISVVQQDDTIALAHIGYCIGRKWWHKGVTSEALGAVIEFLFEQVGMNRVESRHDTRNPNSGRVMQKCGMTYEGTLRQADWNNQGVCDCAWYGLLASDYKRIMEKRGEKME